MTNGPYVVTLVSQVNANTGRWRVEVQLGGQVIRYIDAADEAEADRIIDDLVKMAQELGGQLN